MSIRSISMYSNRAYTYRSSQMASDAEDENTRAMASHRSFGANFSNDGPKNTKIDQPVGKVTKQKVPTKSDLSAVGRELYDELVDQMKGKASPNFGSDEMLWKMFLIQPKDERPNNIKKGQRTDAEFIERLRGYYFQTDSDV